MISNLEAETHTNFGCLVLNKMLPWVV